MDKTSNGVVIAYAEALIDTVYNFLHDENLARDIKTVWFTSNYGIVLA